MKTKEFKVVAVSKNTNSFGLRGMMLMAKDGETWEVGANYLNVKKAGDTLTFSLDDNGRPIFSSLLATYEIPERKADAPAKVVKKVWAK